MHYSNSNHPERSWVIPPITSIIQLADKKGYPHLHLDAGSMQPCHTQPSNRPGMSRKPRPGSALGPPIGDASFHFLGIASTRVAGAKNTKASESGSIKTNASLQLSWSVNHESVCPILPEWNTVSENRWPDFAISFNRLQFLLTSG